MKRFLVGIIIIGLVVAGLFIFKDNKSESKLTKVKVGDATLTSKSHTAL